MILNDYINTNKKQREYFINSITSVNGLPYFGGKSRQIRELYNHIFNMMVQMNNDGNRCKVFVDAFAGGGKIGLTMPAYGWVDQIIINDYDPYIYSFYKACKEKPAALIKMIGELGKVMCEDLFYVLLLDIDDKNTQPFDKDDYVTKAAIIYWITKSSRDGHTDQDAKYSLNSLDDEKKEIRDIAEFSKKHIIEISRILNSKNSIYKIENMDYKDLIGEYKDKDTLFYFDPPYYPYTLAGGKEASYNISWPAENTEAMTNKLLEDDISYFIKSDYDPKDTLKQKYHSENGDFKSFDDFLDNLDPSSEDYKAYHMFDKLEEKPYGKIFLGSYDKGTRDGMSIGNEYIWYKGFKPEYYTQKHN